MAGTADLRELQAALSTRDRRAINALLTRWLDEDAEVGDRWHLFADILAKHGEWTLVLRAMERHVAVAPSDPGRRFASAVMLARAGRQADARAQIAELRSERPRDARLAHFAGALASEAGMFDDARHHFLAAIDADPRSAQTWLELSAVHRFSSDDPLFARLQKALEVTHNPASRAPLLYSIGKAFLDQGRSDEAFAAFSTGADLVAAERPYDASEDAAQAERVMRAWDDVQLPENSRSAREAGIFVTGLPRSGTTLVEQILASHPDVAGGGELNLMQIVVREAGGLEPQQAGGMVDAGARSRDLGALYRRLAGERFASQRRFVDKTLDLGRTLGLVATALPEAAVIWVRRRPLDTAWSCLRTYFVQGVPWSWSQERMAAHFAVEDRLFAFWNERLGDRLLCVDYEALVSNSEHWITRIEAHAGLEHDPRTFQPHLTERHVFTSSVLQVRQPIHQGAIGSANPLRDKLSPFLQAYETASSAGLVR